MLWLLIFHLNKTQEEVVEWFKEFYDDLEVRYVNYCYDIGDIVKAVRRLTNLQQIRSYLVSYKQKRLREEGCTEDYAEENGISLHPPPATFCYCNKKEYPNLNALEDAIEKLEDRINKLKDEMDVNTDRDLFCGTAFLVLNRQNQATRLANYFEVPLFRRAISFLLINILKCRQRQIDERYWDGQRIYVERAAEPTDVYWENLNVTTLERVKIGFKTYGITLLCLLISFGVNLGLSFIKETLEGQDSTSTIASIFISLITLLTSFFVVFVNVVLGRVVRILSAYEKHETYSKYHLSVSVKLTIALFINTGIVPLFVNFGRKNYFDQGGLMVDIFYNTFTIAFISPIFYYFNPIYFWKKWSFYREEKRGEDSKLTQRQANLLVEGPPLDMAQRYANTMLLFCLTVFYTFPLPITPLFALGGTIFQYWLEKYILLRRHKIPEQMGATMAQVSSNMIPYLC